tara:strand:+ start:289 stop:477 length:189 start_codon:yes stop_codon:yes gene_type:complete
MLTKQNIVSVKEFNDITGELSVYIVTHNTDMVMSVPLDPNNTDYQVIQEWAEIDGNTIADAD